jgi:hypothetical protein
MEIQVKGQISGMGAHMLVWVPLSELGPNADWSNNQHDGLLPDLRESTRRYRDDHLPSRMTLSFLADVVAMWVCRCFGRFQPVYALALAFVSYNQDHTMGRAHVLGEAFPGKRR